MTHLDWSGCRNTRDLGGLPTRYGVRTRAGALIRTDSLHQLDPAGRAAFDEVGAGLILDLRSDSEQVDGHPLGGDPAYRRIPWIDPLREAEFVPSPDLAAVYRGSLSRNREHIGQILRVIAEAPTDSPVVLHCHAGKDRTGLLVALLLELVGVPREVKIGRASCRERVLMPV